MRAKIRLSEILPGVNLFFWFEPVGKSVRLFSYLFSAKAIKKLHWGEIRDYCGWMGHRSFHFVALSSVVIAIALTFQCVMELKRYQAEDLTGAAISIGLLRELGPLTISIAWCARVSALVSEEARNRRKFWVDEKAFARAFILPRLIAALAMSVPLGAYGLLIGFITAGIFAPYIGVASLSHFVDSAREAIKDTDIIVYFVKLIAINPLIGVMVGSISGLRAISDSEPVAANAVTGTFLACLALNLAVTIAAYYGN